MFSKALDGDYNSSPSDTQSANNAWSASSLTMTDAETDSDAGQRATGGPLTDYQADHNCLYVPTLIF